MRIQAAHSTPSFAFGGLCLMWVIVMKVVSESHVKRTDRVGILELFFCVLAAYLNPRKWHDMVPIYCPPCPVYQESQARRKGESCPKQGLAGECFGLLPLAQMKQLRSSSCVRIRAVLGSELDPACAWLSLAGSRPCGFRKVSPDVGGGSSGRLGLRPGHSGTS